MVELLNDETVDIFADYVISQQSAVAWDQIKVYDSILARASELEGAERSVGHSLVGPHKHEVHWIFNSRDARFFCSQGQQRAIALSALLARARMFQQKNYEAPLLMLVDVFSEFDEEKVFKLFDLIGEFGAQTFITTVDPRARVVTKAFDRQIYEIEKGMIKHQDGNCV